MEMDLTKENAQELMNLIDGDGSGEIDFNEFCA
jgi:Ca2+-binding EF-hand superfamily protein